MKYWKYSIKHVLMISLLAISVLLLYGCGKKEEQLEPCTVKDYDGLGKMTGYSKKDAYDFATESYDGDGNLQNKYETKRDSDGRLTERKTYDGEGNLVIISKYEYKGETATVTNYNPDGQKTGNISEWEFDSGNRTVKVTTFNEEGDPIFKNEIERDSRGNIKEITIYDGSSGELKIANKQKIDTTYKDGRAVSSEIESTYYKDGKALTPTKTHREYEYED